MSLHRANTDGAKQSNKMAEPNETNFDLPVFTSLHLTFNTSVNNKATTFWLRSNSETLEGVWIISRVDFVTRALIRLTQFSRNKWNNKYLWTLCSYFPRHFGARKNTTQLAKHPRVLSVKLYNNSLKVKDVWRSWLARRKQNPLYSDKKIYFVLTRGHPSLPT